jgi:hypothetical protein
MKSTLYVLLLYLLLPGSYSLAQGNNVRKDSEIINSDFVDAELTDNIIARSTNYSSANTAMIYQEGVLSKAEIIQVNSSGKEKVNLACIVQAGSENNASIKQCGEGNINAIYQDGNNNCGIQTTDGSGNHSILKQQGDDNRSTQILIGDNLRSTVFQIGNCNMVYRIETGNGGLDYRVTQIGDGMRMSVINGK